MWQRRPKKSSWLKRITSCLRARYLIQHHYCLILTNTWSDVWRLDVSQRFKGTEVELVTEEVQAVKIHDTPKESKLEAVDEVLPSSSSSSSRVFDLLWARVVSPPQGPPKFTKSILKKGDKTNFPKKGDTVSCWYSGTLEDGTVFDTNIPACEKHCRLLYFRLSGG